MKKGRMLKIVFALIVMLSFGKVKAVYYNGNGISGGSAPGAGGCPTDGDAICPYGNSNDQFKAIKLTVQWCKNGTCSQLGESEYWSTDASLNSKFKSTSVFSRYDNYTAISDKVRKYFGVDREVYTKEPTQSMIDFFKRTVGNDWKDQMAKKSTESNPISQEANKKVAAKYGFRIFIEPVWRFYRGGNLYFYTVKESAKVVIQNGWRFSCNTGGPGICNNAFLGYNDGTTGFASSLYVNFDDVGISSADPKSTCFASTGGNGSTNRDKIRSIAQQENGCGINIIDITWAVQQPKCYDEVKEKVSGNIICLNTDKNNEASFTEKYVERKCTVEEDKKDTNTKDGKLIKELDNCSVYCVESAFASLPGNIGNPLYLDYNVSGNAYFPWPSRKGSKVGMKMSMSDTYTCTIVNKVGKTCTTNDIKTLTENVKSTVKNVKMGAKVKGGNFNALNGQQLSELPSDLKVTDEGKIKFSVTKESYFEIPENVNRYYNGTTQTVHNSRSGSGNWVDRGQGVISLSEKLTKPGKQDLYLKDIQLGVFGDLYKSEYKCVYTTEPTCKCPAGTLKEGTELYKGLTEGKTCSELIRTKCNICECGKDSNYENIGKILTDPVVGQDMTSKQCEDLKKKFCYKTTCKKKDGTEVDITSCVRKEVETNKRTTGEAIEICEKKPEYGCVRNYCSTIKNSEKLIKEYDTCVKEYGESYCYNEYCNDEPCPNCTYHCYTSENKQIDITKCVSDLNISGVKFREAYRRCAKSQPECKNSIDYDCAQRKNCTYELKQTGSRKEYIVTCDTPVGRKVCDKLSYCPSGGCVKSIVYRTIDLDNPFPANNKNGVTTSFSNDGTLGRMPRQNWLSIESVKSNILQARGVKGSKLYTEKTPLYTIVLTPQLIKEIKAYNKNNSYSDFKLNCKNEKNTAACISDFVHTTIYSAIDRKNSVANCYNMSKSEAGFKACYYKNN